jgi:hypothetical protein
MEVARHDAIRFTRFLAALVQQAGSFWQKKTKTALSFQPLKTKTVEIVRDAISGRLFFRKIALGAERTELMSRPFRTPYHPELRSAFVLRCLRINSFPVYAFSHGANVPRKCLKIGIYKIQMGANRN